MEHLKNMGKYHIELNPISRKLCTIVLTWGKYEYQRLPMGYAAAMTYLKENT